MNKRLIANSFIFFAGTIVLSVFNYLYNSFMGRFLGPADYSILGSLLAFISIITMPTNAVATIAMRFSARYHAQDQDSLIKSFLQTFTKRFGWIGVGVMILLAAFSPFLANFLHLPSAVPVVMIAPVIIFTILLPLNRGILQGLQKFGAAIINQNIDPLLKLGLGLLLVKLGLGINGAIGAIIAGTAVAYVLSFLPLRSLLKQPSNQLTSAPKELKEYSFIALVSFLLATIIMNIDILLVKHFFSPHEAGLYAALSTMGKIVLFVTTPIVSVMFPMISDLQGRDQKHYMVLIQSFLLVFIIGIGVVTAYYLFPELVVKILYGSTYLEVASHLSFFGLIMLFYSLINLWVNYFLSIGNRFFALFLALSVIIEIGLLWWRHDSFIHVMQDLMVATLFGFISLTLYYLSLKWQRITELLPGKIQALNHP